MNTGEKPAGQRGASTPSIDCKLMRLFSFANRFRTYSCLVGQNSWEREREESVQPVGRIGCDVCPNPDNWPGWMSTSKV